MLYARTEMTRHLHSRPQTEPLTCHKDTRQFKTTFLQFLFSAE